jgi:hypothetical protein
VLSSSELLNEGRGGGTVEADEMMLAAPAEAPMAMATAAPGAIKPAPPWRTDPHALTNRWQPSSWSSRRMIRPLQRHDQAAR